MQRRAGVEDLRGWLRAPRGGCGRGPGCPRRTGSRGSAGRRRPRSSGPVRAPGRWAASARRCGPRTRAATAAAGSPRAPAAAAAGAGSVTATAVRDPPAVTVALRIGTAIRRPPSAGMNAVRVSPVRTNDAEAGGSRVDRKILAVAEPRTFRGRPHRHRHSRGRLPDPAHQRHGEQDGPGHRIRTVRWCSTESVRSPRGSHTMRPIRPPIPPPRERAPHLRRARRAPGHRTGLRHRLRSERGRTRARSRAAAASESTATARSRSRTTSRTGSKSTGSTSTSGRAAPGRTGTGTTGCARPGTTSTRSSRTCGTRTGCARPRSRQSKRVDETTSPVTRA